jgi:hypothetical protein
MSKKNIILLIIIIILVAGLGIGTYLVMQPKEVTTPKAAGNQGNFLPTTQESQKLDTQKLKYEDSAGFSFEYPVGFTITDKSINDDNYYSYLDMKNSQGNISLIVTDTTYKTLDDWKKANINATLVGATTLGGIKANQYNLSGSLMTIAIEDGILYEIKSPIGDKPEGAHAIIVDSFAFSGQNKTTTTGDTIYEEEEVIE